MKKRLMFLMNKSLIVLIIAIFMACNTSFGEEIKGKVVDGLGRPMKNVKMTFYREDDWWAEQSNGVEAQTIEGGLYSFILDGPIDEDNEVHFIIENVEGRHIYDKKEYFDEIIIPLKKSTANFKDLSTLAGDELNKELSEMLATRWEDFDFFEGEILKHYEYIETSLISFLDNRYIGPRAASFLIELGDPQILELVDSKISTWPKRVQSYPKTHLQRRFEKPAGTVFSSDLEESIKSALPKDSDPLVTFDHRTLQNATKTLAIVDVSVGHKKMINYGYGSRFTFHKNSEGRWVLNGTWPTWIS